MTLKSRKSFFHVPTDTYRRFKNSFMFRIQSVPNIVSNMKITHKIWDNKNMVIIWRQIYDGKYGEKSEFLFASWDIKYICISIRVNLHTQRGKKCPLFMLMANECTVCLRSSDLFYIVTCYIKLFTTSWTHRMYIVKYPECIQRV